ncbi:hypothetical protein CA51_10410 [Rosistilla oblonga]|uniref:hypothetical protein n=1 Tax=Rosistilla oblonga TaxID=2527990 RepID=UPI00118CFCF2|nr:hypothetical protein [Rosistilla oblonga]QDV11180.1 hypothetical protein CA51_10410 [Rosistilla oblonga]
MNPRGPNSEPSHRQRWLQILLTLSVTWVAGGATCYRGKAVTDFSPPPEIFEGTPSREELAAAVNRTDRIEKLQSTSASIKVLSMPALPSLRANLALERPRRIRMRASLPVVMGSGMDLGSNEELFWMKIPEGMGTSLYFARHEDYQRQLQRAILPVDPTWLVDALGMAHIDVSQIEEGPTVRADGKLELKLSQPMVDGTYRRVMVIDQRQGVVTELLLYGPDGRLLANASGEDFRYFEEVQCSLPHDVQLRLTPNGGEPLALKIEIGSYSVNQLLSDDPRLFAMPEDGNERPIDLTRIGQPPMSPVPPTYTVPPPQANYAPLQGFPPPTASPPPANYPQTNYPPPQAQAAMPAANYPPPQPQYAPQQPPYAPASGYVPQVSQGTTYRGVYR